MNGAGGVDTNGGSADIGAVYAMDLHENGEGAVEEYQQDPGVAAGDPSAEGGEAYPEMEFSLVNSLVGDGIQKDKDMGINALAFDTLEDLLWIGTKSGHVTSYYGTQLQKYTSFQVHPTDEVRNIVPLDQNLLVLTNTSLRGQIRRGIPAFTHTSENLIDMHSILYNNRNGRVLLGGMQDKLVEFDMCTQRETRVDRNENPGGTNALLRDCTRFVCAGDVTAGKVNLKDPSTLKTVHTLDAHVGGILSDFDVHGTQLVTCGQTVRRGHPQPDRFLMMYDLRILRAITPIQVLVQPYQLRFLPSVLSSRIVVMSNMGEVQIVETAEMSMPQISLFQVNAPIEGSSAISMDVSPSNQCLAFGDTSNSVHLYSNVPNSVLNPFARETEFADQVEPLTPMDIDDPFAIYSSIPRPHLPPGQTSYASDFWPDRFARQAYRPTPTIDKDILNTMKVVDGVGYARNISGLKRNVVPYPNWRAKDQRDREGDGRNSRHGHRDREESDSKDIDGPGGLQRGNEGHVERSKIPKIYRKVGIKISKMGQDDFDFDRYNRTSFCGLEASLPNSYCNAMLQILYYTEKFRVLMLNHTCENRENCVCCELSFLFHMMDISPPGLPVQSGNFLRAMRTIPEASALGLIFTDLYGVFQTNVPRLIQSWNRFILHNVSLQTQDQTKTSPSGSFDVSNIRWSRVGGAPSVAPPSSSTSNTAGSISPTKTRSSNNSGGSETASGIDPALLDPDNLAKDAEDEDKNENTKEDDEPPPTTIHEIFNAMYGMRQEKLNVCSRCKTVVTKEDNLLLCNLIYPEHSKERNTFAKIVASSMCNESMTQAWCDGCKKYQATTQKRNVKSLPQILSLNAGMDNQQDISYWQCQLEGLYNDNKPPEEAEGGTDDAEAEEERRKKEEQAKEEQMAKLKPPPNVKPCRYSSACTRPDCKFWHPVLGLSSAAGGADGSGGAKGQEVIDIGEKCAQLGVSWVPHKMVVHRHSSGDVTADGNKLPENDPVVESRSYELLAVCYTILEAKLGEPRNIVAAINVGKFYHSRVASAVEQWYVFNDFTINMISPAEAVSVNLKWKLPCVLVYKAAGEEPVYLKDLGPLNPITSEVFIEDKSLASRSGRKRITFSPLSPEEMPKSGDLVAIDAEFVTLNQEESELRSDGKVSTVKAAQLSVARITCVRGSGRHEGLPFIDDYISTQEQVVDYLTKFSGIKPGDLDANFSSKHLTTLKSTYKKLRYLVDTGCIFIGHGLKNDFKVINIVVPAEQVIDTVHLFHLPHNRMVSLKFLCWHFLGKRIQGTTHDSIEDAVTALQLYRKYLQLKAEDRLIEALNTLYETGKENNWKIPDDEE